ncbi:sigma-54-dependent Fis family transcriptional regulator [bacterium]|nr:sigma-54-dependent Fis family transcriptional regulator [candidate division CSSED10-310 bacterium]
MRILVVEDNVGMLKMLERTLKKHGYDTVCVESAEAAIDHLSRELFAAVITDLKLPEKDGIDVLKAAKAADPRTITLIITAYGTIETAVNAMKDGADDFITKPFDTQLLLLQLKRGIDRNRLQNENLLLKESFAAKLGAPKILGNSDKFQEVIRQVQKVGPMDATVLLTGESGTGKELLARAIHHLSQRRRSAFVAINCAAIPNTLLENELFGHERGAYTGADSRKLGKLELADQGTVFLDEIGDMDPFLQAKLLRFLQERQFERVGGNKTIAVNVRVVAATNKDLRIQVRNGQFREDLYYRLSVFPVHIPPLRERPEDIPVLVNYFLDHYGLEFGKSPLKLAPKSMDRLTSYGWPGNVRELQNCIERAAILTPDGIIRPDHIAVNPIRDMEPFELKEIHLEGNLQTVVDRSRRLVERRMIRRALEQNGWNKTHTAKELGVNYKTLLTKIREYDIK